MENSTDYINSISLKYYTGSMTEEITKENYRGIIEEFEYRTYMASIDNDIIDKNIRDIIGTWCDLKDKNSENFQQLQTVYENYQKEIERNKTEIKKSRNTIKVIKLIAEIRGWE